MGFKPRPYIPGRDPTSSRPLPCAPLRPLGEEDVREHSYLRRGVALLREGYAWEAHEVWEELWRATPRGPVRDFLQGLIQCAAAQVIQSRGNRRAAARLLERATPRLLPEVGLALGVRISLRVGHVEITALGGQPGFRSR